MGVDSKVFILGGVTPLKSVRMAEYMANNVAGMDIPAEIIDRLKGVPSADQKKEGLKICIETIRQLREIEGIRGVHIMAIEWEEAVAQIVEGAQLFPRPAV